MSGSQINVTVSNGIAFQSTGIYDIKAYGAVCDGVADDTGSIQQAIDACVAAGGGVVRLGSNDIRTTETITVENDDDSIVVTIDARGANITADAGLAGPILMIGTTDSRSYNIDVLGGAYNMASRDWSSTTGIQVVNLYRGNILDFEVYGCEKGIELLGGPSANGCVYNNVKPRHILDCLYGIYLENSTDGWVNENMFYGDGSIYYSSALAAVDCSSGAAIYAGTASGSYIINTNSFYAISLETAGLTNKPMSLDYDGQHSNFIGLRYEGFADPHISFGANSQMNQIIGGYLAFPQASIDSTSIQRVSVIAGKEAFFSGGNSSYPIMTLKENNSYLNKAFVIKGTGGNDDVYITSGGVIRIAPTAAPASPVEGMILYDAATNKLVFYNGSAWETVTSS